jgi:hypothetical protein
MSPSTAASLRQRVRATVAVLLIAAAALLVAGILLERQAESGTQHSIGATHTEHQESHHDEAVIGRDTEGEPPARNTGEETTEHRTGIGIESPWIVALGTLAAAALAFAV